MGDLAEVRTGSLESIFWANSVAVIGASTTPGKTGYVVLENLIRGGYRGDIYPVNPRAERILGLNAYPSLSAVRRPVDLGIFVVPGELVPDLIDEGRQAGMKGAVVISGGFGEVGAAALEADLVERANRAGIRLIGPNCQGINFTPNRLCATWPLVTERGPIAVISQSGTVGAALSGWAEQEGLGITGFVGLGNKADVSELELVRFFGSDPETKAIAMYLERVKDGARFLDACREVSSSKRIVVLKGGRTPEGRRAAQSHTRSVAGRYEVFSAVCRDLGLIAAKDVESLYDSAKAAALLDQPKGTRIMLITSSGGSGILAADAATDCGLRMASLSDSARGALSSILPSRCVISNPLDLTGDASSERYEQAICALAPFDLADIYVLIFGDPIPGALDAVLKAREKTGKVVAAVYIGGGAIQSEEVASMQRHGIPAYPTPERAVKALSSLLVVQPKECVEA